MKKLLSLLLFVSAICYGSGNNANNPQSVSVSLGSLAADADTAQIQTVTVVADVAASLDAKYFILPDSGGTVAFWIDVDNDGASEPAGSLAATRSIEITTIATGDNANTVGDKVAAAIDADSKFAAPNPAAAVITVTDAEIGARTGQSNGDSGFTVAVTTVGVEGAVLKPAFYCSKAMRIVSVSLVNGATLAASDTDYVQVSLKNSSTEIAELDSRAAHENGITLNTAEALNLSSTYSSVAAGSVLTVSYNETQATSVGLTNAQLVIVWYPL